MFSFDAFRIIITVLTIMFFAGKYAEFIRIYKLPRNRISKRKEISMYSYFSKYYYKPSIFFSYISFFILNSILMTFGKITHILKFP